MNKEKLISLGKDVLLAITVMLLTFLFSKYIIGFTAVVGDSMNDTYQNGDLLLAKKFDKNPDRFDIIIFNTEHGVLIKRVIGLPGDTVRIDYDGNIYLNGEILNENYGKEKILEPGLAVNEIFLAEDEYFVLGDNRNNSSDSRSPLFGSIKRSDIIGTILFAKK